MDESKPVVTEKHEFEYRDESVIIANFGNHQNSDSRIKRSYFSTKHSGPSSNVPMRTLMEDIKLVVTEICYFHYQNKSVLTGLFWIFRHTWFWSKDRKNGVFIWILFYKFKVSFWYLDWINRGGNYGENWVWINTNSLFRSFWFLDFWNKDQHKRFLNPIFWCKIKFFVWQPDGRNHNCRIGGMWVSISRYIFVFRTFWNFMTTGFKCEKENQKRFNGIHLYQSDALKWDLEKKVAFCISELHWVATTRKINIICGSWYSRNVGMKEQDVAEKNRFCSELLFSDPAEFRTMKKLGLSKWESFSVFYNAILFFKQFYKFSNYFGLFRKSEIFSLSFWNIF